MAKTRCRLAVMKVKQRWNRAADVVHPISLDGGQHDIYHVCNCLAQRPRRGRLAGEIGK